MIKLPLYRKRTVELALEFGLLLSEIAKQENIEITPEITDRAEKIFLAEIKINGFKKTALNFTPLLLACLEK